MPGSSAAFASDSQRRVPWRTVGLDRRHFVAMVCLSGFARDYERFKMSLGARLGALAWKSLASDHCCRSDHVSDCMES